MNNSNFVDESGMLSGFHYHDQFLESVNIDNENTILKIKNTEGVLYLLHFKDCLITSIDSFVPGTIVGSCFIWDSNNLPKWFESKKINSSNPDEILYNKKYTFHLTSSYGANIFITFNLFCLMKTEMVGSCEKIWEF